MNQHTERKAILLNQKIPYKMVVNSNIIATFNLNGEMTESEYKSNAARILTMWNNWDEALSILNECAGYFNAPNFTDRYGTGNRISEFLNQKI